MARLFLTPVDLGQLELLNARIQNLGSNPSSPVEGQIYYNTSSHATLIYNGSAWLTLGRLDQLTAPTGDVSMNSHKLTNVTDPSSAQDAATKNYVDVAINGLAWKPAVRAATTANGTLASAFANGSVIDGVTLATNDRILLKAQTTGGENGIYVVAASGAPSRAADTNSGAAILQAAVFVQEGTTNADTAWVNSTNGPITLGTTATVWVQFGAGSSYSAGAGLNLTGTVFRLADATYGDIVISGSGTAINVASSAITYAKMQNVSATNMVLGRATAGAGVVEEIATTGSGNVVRATSATLVTPALGTPSALVGTNITGTATSFTASNVTTNANLTGPVTSSGNATTITANAVTLGMQATLAANTAIANATGSTATPTAVPMVATATASAIAIRDANANETSNSFIPGFATVVTAAGTTTLTVSSKAIQEFTGSSTQTITLPVASTLAVGQSFLIINRSSGNLTVNSSGANLVQTLLPSSTANIVCVLASGTSAASWDSDYRINAVTGTGSSVLSTSPTLVTPNLGTPSTLVGTNITGTATSFTASNVTTNANLTGDVTSSGNATTIASAAVTYAKIQNVSATSRILGRKTAGAGSIEELTAADVKTITGLMTRFAATYGDGTTTAYTITHNLGTLDVLVQVNRVSDGVVVDTDVTLATTNTVTITHAVAPATNTFRCVVIG